MILNFYFPLLVLFQMVLLANTQAATVDLKKAVNFEQRGQYLEAAKVFSLCLGASTTKEYSNLEECLYKGESFSYRLAEIVTNQAMLETSGKSIENWKGLSSYKKMGLLFKWNNYIFNYQNEFFKKLKTLFPESSYRAEYELALIILESTDIAGFKKNEKDLKDYLVKFPEGPWSIKAKFKLASIYDNLWELTKGVRGSDDYSQKAKTLYSEILSHKLVSVLTPEDLRIAKEKLKTYR